LLPPPLEPNCVVVVPDAVKFEKVVKEVLFIKKYQVCPKELYSQFTITTLLIGNE
jgi:hypothetical protein